MSPADMPADALMYVLIQLTAMCVVEVVAASVYLMPKEHQQAETFAAVTYSALSS
jgi:hypothetical protein